MRQLIISCSLSPSSRSALLAEALAEVFRSRGSDVELIDLREVALPLCDGAASYEHPNVAVIRAAIDRASAVAIATPIYNFDVGGATRNLIAMTGKVWTDKVVAFLCAAGGQGSYMAVMGLANSLMLAFRSVVVPRFVYATGAAFDGDIVSDSALRERIGGLADELHRFATALTKAPG